MDTSYVQKKGITKKTIGKFLVYAITGLFLVLVFLKNYTHFSFSLFQLNAIFLVISGICTVGFFLFRSLAWSKLLQLHNITVSKTSAAYYLSSSELIRYIPGNIWGLGARVVRGKNFQVPHDIATHSLIEETISILSSACLLALCFLFFAGHTLIYWIIAICLVVGIFGIFFFRNLFKLLRPFISRLFRISFSDELIRVKQLIRLYPYHLCMWASFGLAHVFFFKGISALHVPFAPLMAFSLVGWVAGFVSLLTPSGLGVREVFLTIGIGSLAPVSFSAAFSVAVRCWFILFEVGFVAVTGLLHAKNRISKNK